MSDDKKLRRSDRPRKPNRYVDFMSQKENTSPRKRKSHTFDASTSSTTTPASSPRSGARADDEESDDSEIVDVESSDHEECFSSDFASGDSQESPSKKAKGEDNDPNKKERDRRKKEAKNFDNLREVILPGLKHVSHEDTLDHAFNYISSLEQTQEDQEEMSHAIDMNIAKLELLEKVVKETALQNMPRRKH